jgi:uncharacterized membrane protein YjdF
VSDGSDDGSGEIFAGAITNYREPSFRQEQHRAATSRWLAFVIIVFLALSVASHYAVIAWMTLHGHGDVVQSLDRIFDVWLPVISGLASAAVTYYFTKGSG